MALSKIQAESMNLADTYTFTGSVSGAGGGKVGQVITSVYNTQSTTTSVTLSDTGHSAIITPSSTNSKVFVQLTYRFRADRRSAQSDFGVGIAILRDSTTILDYSDGGFGAHYFWHSSTLQFDARGYKTLTCIDSPSSTSALTYKVQHNAYADKNTTGYYARDNDTCTLTLMEILA